ncbi:MAG: bifunctional 4-hydroxy-2-oxoglutarate aldolase/2-dehydro-3-deoxy-phosphogluconate aldolase, partial [Opitutales bacterium]|nr:bifunctional 4-hydroxy-2-oxoglutarate aldolase/2-dehydro-3-deoxy-phosphogluconate aldolase [Opitutales bacterium]
GFFTPSNVTQALSFGCEVQKFFPAESMGPAFLSASLAAFNHKHNLKVIAAGGITPENIARWLVVPQVVACGASWVCPKEMIEAEDWAGITARVQQLLAIAHSGIAAA